ncbi:ATP/GTP-binding protein [Streptomyces sp. NPDC017615]|uniref:AAA family ATPase n=1 Tax=unclassified Streptomyces TaxID=2593676 RepID=UPI00136F24B9|nr:ATP-binding protein [Streptomyces sp. SID4982]MYS15444.1 AAA family ATPase [Streptomyces sp. SID4982]
MLLSFRVANHGSLRDPQELNLVPAYTAELPALPVVAIYGANASGKSTVMDAYRFFQKAVRESQARWLPGDPVERRPFLLDHDTRRSSSSYAVDLLIDGVRHVYGFSVGDRSVEQEWLYSYPKARRRVLFERAGGSVTFGASLAGERAAAERIMRANSLYLSAAAQSGHATLGAVWEALQRTNVIDDQTRQALMKAGSLTATVFDSFERLGIARAEELLAAADLGVHGVRPGQDEDPGLRRRFGEKVWEEHFAAGLGDAAAAFRQVMTRQLQFVHRVGGEEFLLGAEDESAGTKTWLNLVSLALLAITSGDQLWIDEVDVSLHPLLTAKLVKLFQSTELNPLGAQLVFTTHDASLLGTMLGEEVLRRDQIWFVEKDAATGASELYPLSDFKPRKGENFERRYLAGSYGAVPLLPDGAFEDMVKQYWGARGKAVSA